MDIKSALTEADVSANLTLNISRASPVCIYHSCMVCFAATVVTC